MSRVRVSTLPNGLTVITDPMPQVATVALGVFIGVGARHETPEVNGVTHLIEHMLFKGTKRRNARQIAEAMEDVGGQMNAYTGRETTAFYAKVLKEDTALALDVIGDLILNASFDPAELDRERQVILQEIGEARDIPDDIVFDEFQARAYPDQAIGRPVLGTEVIVRNLPRADILAYLRATYVAKNMVVAAAGAVDHEAFVRLVETGFEGLASGEMRAPEPASYRGGDLFIARDLEQVHMVLGFDGIPVRDPDYYAIAVLSVLLGGGMSSRLFQEIREARGLAYSIYSFTSAYEDGGLFGVYIGTDPARAGEAFPVILSELHKTADALTEAEIDRAKAQLKAMSLMSLESVSGRCEQAARHIMAYGRPIPTEEIVEKIRAVGAGDLKRVAERVFSSRATFTALGPQRALSALQDMDARRFAAG